MFRSIHSKLRFWQLANHNGANANHSGNSQSNLFDNLNKNLTALKGVFGNSYDLNMREFNFGDQGLTRGAIIFLSGMTDTAIINESIIKPLMYDIRLSSRQETSLLNNMSIIQTTLLTVGMVQKASKIDEVVDGCLSGKTILLIDGSKEALVIGTEGWETRGVDEPKTESVVRGPREGFTENLLTNTTLLRRKIKNPNLTLETMKIGERTKTIVCVAYLKDLVHPQLIKEIQRRLNRIKTDAILESGYIEQFIEDAPFSIFSTVANSEKPDLVAAKILEGRAAIFVDGTPFVLSVPMVFIESFQSAEDYYSRPYFASVVRLLRLLAFLISITAPAIYVALTTFHQELIPTSLLFTMAASEEGVPFPAMAEALIMGTTFEILREAGVRLPRPIGQAVSIVGALVIGEAAVGAGIIGEPMVIVIALTAICSFVVPSQTDSGSILRLILVLLAGAMGGFGIAVGLMGTFIHLASLRSFGTPYLSPFAPLSTQDLKDTFIRAPIWAMFTRPRTIGWHDPERQEFRLKPSHPSEEDKS
ncbi:MULTISPECIES: spore germination protein [Dehalobacter]|uniref:spore germination protein n=1 Tax=Dehalobacter TaxID=56112 RepID=UPI00258B41C2|nr:spore germination protein [Dehalobacter sp.]MDJ0304804.1 spore germination protein [Dehalobacter sp.]